MTRPAPSCKRPLDELAADADAVDEPGAGSFQVEGTGISAYLVLDQTAVAGISIRGGVQQMTRSTCRATRLHARAPGEHAHAHVA